jgi:ribokinase
VQNKPAIISLGNINIDFQVRAERWPHVGEEILAADFLQAGGGKAANVAYIARLLGVPSILIGRVGDDELGEQALKGLRQVEVDLRFTRAIRGASTGVAIIVVQPDGSRGILIAANINYDWTRADADDAVNAVVEAPAGSVLVVNFGVSMPVVERAVEAAQQRNFVVVADPSPPGGITEALFRTIDVITPNAKEAEQLTGIRVKSFEDSIRAGHLLLQRGVATAFVRLAGGACAMVTKQGSERFDPVPVEVVDKTGAGDAFTGALAVGLLERREASEAGKMALAAAHVAVTRYGSQRSYPDRAQLETMLARLQEDS